MTFLPPTYPSPPLPPGTIQEQPADPLRSIWGGIHSRNLLPALALGGLIGMIPPLFYKKRDRRGATRFWDGVGTELATNELNRPERDAQNRRAEMDRLLSTGAISPTGAPGAAPVGSMAGVDLYKTPTLGDLFPSSRPSAPPQLTGESVGANEPAYVGPPASPSMDVFGSLPATADNRVEYAKDLREQGEIEEARRQREATLRAVTGEIEQNPGLVAIPGVSEKGLRTVRAEQKRMPGAGRAETNMEAWIRLAQQKKGEPLTPNEEEAVRREHTPPSLSEQLEAAFTKQDRAQQKAAVAALQKELDDYVRLVPEQYQTAAETPSMWKALKKDAKAMAEIDEDDYNAIAGLHRQIGRYGPQLDAFLREHSPDPTRKGGVRVSPQDIETEARSLLLR